MFDKGIQNPFRRRCLLATLAGATTAIAIPPALAAGPITGHSRRGAPTARQLDPFADAARAIERLRAVVVMHAGDVIFAESFRGPAPTEAVNIKSVSKSVVAALVGCAIQQGVVDDLDMTLDKVTPALLPEKVDPRVAALTLKDFITMRAGLERTSGPAYSRWVSSPDWLDYVLTRHFVDEPGSGMLYSTGNFHVLGAVLSTLTESSLHRIARRWLGEPLDIDFAPWTRDPQGRFLGGNEMSLSPIAMARFGELYRRDGTWDDQRVLPESWVKDSFTPRSISPWSNDGYGYGWFVRSMGDTLAGYARGYGGQMIHVLPTEQLVVAITSDPTLPARGDGYVEQLHGLVETHLLG